MASKAEIARAFNLGSDARLAGKDKSFNPYSHKQYIERKYFNFGWNHVNNNWGKTSLRPFRALPAVTLFNTRKNELQR